MVRNQCNAEARFDDGAVYVCTKWRGHNGPHHAYDADTNVEFYRDSRTDRVIPDCVLPGCRNPVAEPGDTCASCVTAFGTMLRPAPRLSVEQIVERDTQVRAAYTQQTLSHITITTK